MNSGIKSQRLYFKYNRGILNQYLNPRHKCNAKCSGGQVAHDPSQPAEVSHHLNPCLGEAPAWSHNSSKHLVLSRAVTEIPDHSVWPATVTYCGLHKHWATGQNNINQRNGEHKMTTTAEDDLSDRQAYKDVTPR
ncbi:hypothetical protein RRG08_033332 [Elysia crispata]|uniref:Uncharacterized protein n=1 Tax=Elysia crispata TaxID=231223 RepID=A0AAE0XMU0_9GAST|nr:hypothetical protein RRG08_033332 [Elysia crispata]